MRGRVRGWFASGCIGTLKAARIVEMNNMGVTGRILPPNTDFEHARVWPT